MSDVTQILKRIDDGDPSAAESLLPLVYEELRKLAAAKLARESPGQTLQATALVHEAYLRLVKDDEPRSWDSRGHFFAAAAESMRRILVENARKRSRLKRGGRRERVELDDRALASPEANDMILAVDEQLDALAEQNAKAAELVKLRYFAGLPLPRAAEALGVSPRTADRLWAYARAFLKSALED